MLNARVSALVLLPLGLAAAASGQTVYSANFDSFVEGSPTLVLATGGLTFSDLDQRIPGQPPPSNLVIEDGSSTLAGQPGFTPNNALGFSGYSPGPGAAFTRLGSVTITPDTPCTDARLHVYEFATGVGNSVVLAAYRAGVEVARHSLPLLGGFTVHHYELFVQVPSSAPFDQLRLMGEGPNDQGVFFGLVDSVTATGEGAECYANCDESTMEPVLNVADFTCFLQRYAAGDSYANCDESTVQPVLNVADFTCFLQRYAAGCS